MRRIGRVQTRHLPDGPRAVFARRCDSGVGQSGDARAGGSSGGGAIGKAAQSEMLGALIRGVGPAALMFQARSGTLTKLCKKSIAGYGVLSGSFNPLHAGHRGMADAAAAKLQSPVVYEISVGNADKGAVDGAVLQERMAQFVGGGRDLVLTRAPLFVGKAAVLPGTNFVVGWDTAARILDPKYYRGNDGLADVLESFKRAEVRLVVAGRVAQPGTNEGAFLTLSDLVVPTQYTDVFVGLSEAEFRIDLSSSILRAAAKKAHL